jgi:hypothetical protein
MATLASYRKAEFSQGAELKAQYPFKPEVQNGICFALMVEWILKLKNNAEDPAKRMSAMSDELKLAGGRQMIYTSALRDVVNAAQAKGETVDQSKLSDALTELGRHFGIQFTYQGGSVNKAALANYLSDGANANKLLYLSIKFNGGGGHAIGVYTSNPILVFDPNIGEFAVPKASSGDFVNLLWIAYSGLLGGIKLFFLSQLQPRESTFEFWEKKAGGK